MVTQSFELGAADSRWVRFSCGKLCYHQNVDTLQFSLEEPTNACTPPDEGGAPLRIVEIHDHDKKNFRQRLTQARRTGQQARVSSGEFICETTAAMPAGRSGTLPSRFEATQNKDSQVFLASLRAEEARRQRMADTNSAQEPAAAQPQELGRSPLQQLQRVLCLPCKVLYCLCILPTKCMPDCAPSQINLDGTLRDAEAHQDAEDNAVGRRRRQREEGP